MTFSPLWIALWVSFVGIAGIYACTTADNRKTHNRRREGNIEERGPMVVEGGQDCLPLGCRVLNSSAAEAMRKGGDREAGVVNAPDRAGEHGSCRNAG